MTEFIEIIKAIIFGVVEGITEWLPVSSTGHLILLDEFLKLNVAGELGPVFAEEYMSMFEVVIQLGAILAVVVMFFRKLNPFALFKSAEEKKATWTLWFKVVIASVPAALIGIVGDKILEKITGKDIDGWIYNWVTVAITLIVYGVLFIVVEKWQANKPIRVDRVDDISYSQAFLVGCFQTLSIIPGTSRSGSTILGARTIGISRSAAAEFSFFMGIPAMVGASLIKGYGFFDYVAESGVSVPALAWIVLAAASVVAFGVSMVCIKFLMEFVKKHSFAPFGVYRIILGALVILYFCFAG
ncbi:MAG: undecaprenyl-diphosphate phosphatase [Ruminococcaceae bacterium]|nr:undecaprenyl-diphosphate phosphatase [Oscillospiraceae bacterium]